MNILENLADTLNHLGRGVSQPEDEVVMQDASTLRACLEQVSLER
jgi:hypothetical protein